MVDFKLINDGSLTDEFLRGDEAFEVGDYKPYLGVVKPLIFKDLCFLELGEL